MKLRILLLFFLSLFGYSQCNSIAKVDLSQDRDGVIEITQSNFYKIMEHVRGKNGTLVLHTYKNRCAACININKNLKEFSQQVQKKKDLKEKIFVAKCNLSQNRNLENHYFVAPYPKVFYFTAFENMRKRQYKENTRPFIMMNFFKSLSPSSPPLYLPQYSLRNISRHIYEGHLILGLFPKGDSEAKNGLLDQSEQIELIEQFKEVYNKYSHLAFYECNECEGLAKELNITLDGPEVVIYRKPEITPDDTPKMIFWNQSEPLMKFIERDYHLPVDIYSHDSKPIYDLHADDIGLIFYNGANTLYHEGENSTLAKLFHLLHHINYRLGNASSEFTTPESQKRWNRFSLCIARKQEFWIWAKYIHHKMEMDFTEEFTPIVRDSRRRFYMNPALANMTIDSVDEDGIYQFFYDYIQGDLGEYNKSESLDLSYVIGKDWRRNLKQASSGTELSSTFDQVEIRRIVAQNFRSEVEEKGVEGLVIFTSHDCEFCEVFINRYMMEDFVPNTKYSPDFKVFIMEASENSVPEEYTLMKLPQIMFSPKETENYDPVMWWTDNPTIKDMRKFLRQYSKVFPKIDTSKK